MLLSLFYSSNTLINRMSYILTAGVVFCSVSIPSYSSPLHKSVIKTFCSPVASLPTAECFNSKAVI